MEEVCPSESFGCDETRNYLGRFNQRIGPVALCQDCHFLLVKSGEIY